MKIPDFFKEKLPFFNNYTLVQKQDWNHIVTDYNAIMKEFDRNSVNDNSRPSLAVPYIDTATGAKIPMWQLSPVRIYDMANEIGDLRIVFEIIQREMFKNGWEIKPTFKYKCGNCFKTFKDKPMSKFVPLNEKIADGSSSNDMSVEKPAEETEETTNENFGKAFPPKNQEKPIEQNSNPFGNKENADKPEELEPLECDECGNKDPKLFYKPDPKNRVKLEALMAVPANNNNQTLIDVGRSYERDLDVIDNAYTLVSQRYFLKQLSAPDPETGALMEIDETQTKIEEFIRLDPINIAKLSNAEGRLGYDNQNKPVWICPQYEHRDKRLEKPVCDRCQCKAVNAIIEVNNVPYGLPVSDPKRMMYSRDEIIWTSGKFQPDLLYGKPLILAIWKKAMSLYHQDEYIWKYFDKDRPPKSLLIFGTRNYESVKSFMERQKQGAKSDPYMPRPLLVNAENAAQAAQFIDLTPNFKELELTELRKELRQVIITLYGLSPVSAGEQKGSGLGNEGLQLTLQNRSIKWYQSIFNEQFFKQITKRIFKIDDWEILLVDSEEIDEMRTEQIKGQKIDNASKMAAMGYDHHTDGNGEFTFSQFPNPEKEAQSGGMGMNIKQGNLDKVKSTKPAGEDKSNFGGEPKDLRPSDEGGKAQGDPTGSGFSMSNKSFAEFRKVADIINKGLVNNWTFTNMAKKISKETGWSQQDSSETIAAMLKMKIEDVVIKSLK